MFRVFPHLHVFLHILTIVGFSLHLLATVPLTRYFGIFLQGNSYNTLSCKYCFEMSDFNDQLQLAWRELFHEQKARKRERAAATGNITDVSHSNPDTSGLIDVTFVFVCVSICVCVFMLVYICSPC